MEPATVSLREADHDLLTELSGDDGAYKNRSEAMRHVIDRYNDISELENRIEQLKTENERIKRERRQVLEQKNENQELARFIEDQKSVLERQEERKNRPIWTRAYVYIFGERG